MRRCKNEVLTAARARALLKYNRSTGKLVWKENRGRGVQAGDPAGTLRPDGYVQVRLDGVSYLAHRLIWLLTYGRWPSEEIDHQNRDRADNRLRNLRDVPKTAQQQNMSRPPAASGFRGVRKKPSGRFTAYIVLNRKQKVLGTFDTAEEAGAVAEAARVLHYPFYIATLKKGTTQ